MTQPARFLVGIDLGTVHTALAYVDLAAEGDPADSLTVLEIPQLIAAGEVGERRLLPSSAYLPGEHELPAAQRRLPWDPPGEPPEREGAPEVVVGELARAQGARVPGRLVASAKSWLSHPRVDRTAAILPWGAPEGVPRLSPVAASALYLTHLRAAWRLRFPGHPLEEQEVVLTVPASFDEAARELTLRAAHEAGLARLTLLEEPQAAFYDFTRRHRGSLEEALGGSRLVLVCDVGGGTTDLTLIRVAPSTGGPTLSRLAVGDHLLLGGDNVDAALARAVEARLSVRLDAPQWALLVQACRAAKERLLEPSRPGAARLERATVTVPGRGSRLVGGTLSAELTVAEVRSALLDGFFPRVGPGERPRARGRGALQELGLPYESDPAITRHVLGFLRDHAAESDAAGAAESLPRPDALLLNGGVFKPVEARERLREVVSSWFPGAPPVALLDAAELDLAVARGAAWSALVRRGLGLRIGGGTPRAYYVQVASADGAPQALCLVPRHLEEGSAVEVPRTFALRLGEPVRFALYATTRARFEQPGDVVAMGPRGEPPAGLSALPPVETVLRAAARPSPGGRPSSQTVPVRLRASLTEIGTLELFCVAEDRDARWKLEFNLRGEAEGAPASEAGETLSLPRRFGEARELVELYYGKKPAPVERRDVKGLHRALEAALGPRQQWSLPVLRELWAALHAGFARRRRSAGHERLWLSLTGYALRPGFGAPLDAWRAAETFRAFGEGLQFQAEPHNWQAWWVLWRRIAGGLAPAAQERLLDALLPFLCPPDPRRPRPKVAGVREEAVDEMIRLAASLERVNPARKRAAGEAVLARLEAEGVAPHTLWAVGRLGARVPFHGGAHACVGPEVAEAWLARLVALPVKRAELAFPVAQLARRSGDRALDLSDEARASALRVLGEARAPEALVHPVREAVALAQAEEVRIFGESLPAGLVLVE